MFILNAHNKYPIACPYGQAVAPHSFPLQTSYGVSVVSVGAHLIPTVAIVMFHALFCNAAKNTLLLCEYTYYISLM